MKSEISTQFIVHIYSSYAAPNPPLLTATPLYDSSGGLLEIESQARVEVSHCFSSCLAVLNLNANADTLVSCVSCYNVYSLCDSRSSASVASKSVH